VFLFWSAHNSKCFKIKTYIKRLFSAPLVSLLIAGSFTFYVLSVTGTTVADSLLIQGAAPIFVLFMGWLFLKEKLSWISLGALAAVITGIGIIMLPSINNGGLSGNLFGILKALSFASAVVLIRRKKSIGMVHANSMAALISLCIAALIAPGFHLDLVSLIVLLYLGVIQIGLAFILFTTFSGRLSSAQTGIIVILEAVLGPVWPWLILGQTPSVYTLSGGFIILGALAGHTLLFNRFAKKAAKSLPSPS
jgi:drug/metabolite transporter, DME family